MERPAVKLKNPRGAWLALIRDPEDRDGVANSSSAQA
jgi:hypothetical protein